MILHTKFAFLMVAWHKLIYVAILTSSFIILQHVGRIWKTFCFGRRNEQVLSNLRRRVQVDNW